MRTLLLMLTTTSLTLGAAQAITPTPTPQPIAVVINEVLPNAGSDWDGNGQFQFNDDEWTELYNDSPFAVNLGGFRLGDSQLPDQYRIPNITLEPFCWTVIYNRQTRLQFGNQGDTVYLSDPSGRVIDQFTYLNAPQDVSYRRRLDGFVTFEESIPCGPGSSRRDCPNPGFSNDGSLTCGGPTPTPSPIPTSTPPPSATNTPTPSVTGTPLPSDTPTATPTPSATNTCAPTPPGIADIQPEPNSRGNDPLTVLRVRFTDNQGGVDRKTITLTVNQTPVPQSDLAFLGSNEDLNVLYAPLVPFPTARPVSIRWTVCGGCPRAQICAKPLVYGLFFGDEPATSTPPPTLTRTATPTPSVTPTPSATPQRIGASIGATFSTARELNVTLALFNRTNFPFPADLYIVTDIGGALYFFPNFTTTPAVTANLTLTPNLSLGPISLWRLSLPTKLESDLTMIWYALMLDVDTAAPLGELSSATVTLR